MLMGASVRNSMRTSKIKHTIGREEGREKERGEEGWKEREGEEGGKKRDKERRGEKDQRRRERGREREERGGRSKRTPLHAHMYLPTKGLRLSEESRKAHRRPMRCSLPLSCSTIANTSDVSSSQAM